jgi:Protein of Unknown function (DUF2784)
MERRSWYPEDPESCLALADGIVVVHFAIVLFVIFGLLATLTGGVLHWSWVRNLWFRVGHLLLIGFVAGQSVVGQVCPLTIWENELRAIAGEPLERSSFVAYWAHELLFIEASEQTFMIAYVSFAALVLASFFFVPVRWRRSATQ